jgi:hypothetical protein
VTNDAVRDALSDARLAPYLAEVGDDLARAIDLYEWNSRMAAECFVAIGHLEVLLRNAMDKVLAEYSDEAVRGIPWFMQMGLGLSQGAEEDIKKARRRMVNDRQPDSRDRVVANLMFGFWVELLNSRYDELWKSALHKVFPGEPSRKKVENLAKRVQVTRNRVAHHNFMKAFDVPRAMGEVFELAAVVSPEFSEWMRERSLWNETYSACPEVDVDTVVVAGRVAWDVYQEYPIYVSRVGRYFRDVEHLAFYESQSIRGQVPKILCRYECVSWTEEQAVALSATGDPGDKKVAAAIRWAISDEGRHVGGENDAWPSSEYQVFLLTERRGPGHQQTGHVERPTDVPHRAHGRGSAFTQRQRYVSLHALLGAKTTADLMATPEQRVVS